MARTPPGGTPLTRPIREALEGSAPLARLVERVQASNQRYRVIEQFLMGPGKMLLRRAPVSVRFDPQTGTSFAVREAGDDAGVVTVVGSADELALFAYGRDEQARVEFVGEPADVAALRSAKREL